MRSGHNSDYVDNCNYVLLAQLSRHTTSRCLVLSRVADRAKFITRGISRRRTISTSLVRGGPVERKGQCPEAYPFAVLIGECSNNGLETEKYVFYIAALALHLSLIHI